jgi:hypothetical protein
MPPIRAFAIGLGLLYIILGGAGFIDALRTPAPEYQGSMTGETWLTFGVFASNLLLNVIYLATGLAGIVAGLISWSASRLYSRLVAVVFFILFFAGLVSGQIVVADIVPLNLPDTSIHFITWLVAAYFGFMPAYTERRI